MTVPITQLQKKVEELKEEEEIKVESYKNVLRDKQQLEGAKNEPRLPTSLPPPGQQQQPSPLPRRQPVQLMPPAQLHPGAPPVVAPAPAVPLQSPPPSELMDVDPSAGPPSQAVAVQPVLQPLSLGTPKESDTAAPCPAPTQQPSTQRQETLPLFVGPDAPKDDQELTDKEEQEKSELQRLLGEKLSQLINFTERDQQVMKKDKLNQKSGSYNNEGAGLKAEAEAAAEKQARMNELLQGEKKQYEVAKSELELYVLPESTEKEKFKLLIQNLKKMTERLIKTKEEKQQMLERFPVVEKDLMLAKDEKKQLPHEEEICSKQLNVIRMKLHEAHQTMRKSVSSNKVVEYLTNCKLENKLPGFFGRLGDLGAIDEMYDVAVSTACGYLNHMVVGTVKTAQESIELLRGGHTVKKGLMSQKVPEAPVTQKTVEDLGKKMQECQKKLEEFTRKIHEIDKKMCFLTPEINNMKTKTQKLETEIMTLQREHPKLEHEVKNQEKRVLKVTVDPAKVATLTLVMGKAKKDYDDAMQKAQEVSSEVNCLSNEIEDKINNRVGLIKKNVEENKKKLSSKCYEITKTKADIKRAERFTDEFGIVAHPLVQGVIPKIGLLQQQTEIKVNMLTRFGNIMKSNKKIEEINTEIVHLENVINVYKNRNSYLLNLVKDINIELNKVTINHQLFKLTAIEMNKNAMSLCQQW
ncbi:structural maintenance of chromosomes protein 4-like [Schistocerca serialis cubense]|uniref:structural maintenance of chromosomes protein 4-like n=1 Tax=Schistocerca serialis cubense TaxID=2023355 RepID=UPI00214EBC63|nr:structural maintenance of chromosomes protein 4-like [Schistocerca serialis cubense]